ELIHSLPANPTSSVSIKHLGFPARNETYFLYIYNGSSRILALNRRLITKGNLMATPIKLATGLGGAIGSDFVRSGNQLYFVEFNGKLSVLNLVRPLVGIVAQG